MLTAAQFDVLISPISDLYEQFAQSVIVDIARRLANMDMTATAAWQAQRLTESGLLFEEIMKRLAVITGKSESVLKQIFLQAGVKAMKFDHAVYRAAGLEPLPLNLSPSMARVLSAGIQKTAGILRNLTMSTASTGQQAFLNAADLAYMQVSHGAMSYSQAIRQAIKKLAGEGLSTVNYANGHVDQLDVAMRRAVLTGITQTTGVMQLNEAAELGVHLVQTSAHIGARPTHEVWQGKIFCVDGSDRNYPDFRESTGYGTPGGLCGVNCRHSFYPFFKGISENAYNQATLDDYAGKTVTYNGREMSVYEATQKQRSIEREIRKAKREAAALSAGGQGNEVELARVKLLQARLRSFVNQTGLKRQPEREGGRVAKTLIPTSTPIWAKKIASKSVEDLIDTARVPNEEILRQIHVGAASIDSVHNLGKMPKVPIVQGYGTSLGRFVSQGSNAIKIDISKHGNHPAFTFAHEFGHLLDHSAFGTTWSSLKAGGSVEKVILAAQNTTWYKTIWDRLQAFNTRPASGSVMMLIRSEYVDYLLKPEEVFARSYAQYIASKSGNGELLQQLAKLQADDFPAQWADQDFESVITAFDELFKTQGWLK